MLDDNTLEAWLDGSLDELAAIQLADQVACDPKLARELARHRTMAMQVRVATETIDEQDLPRRLTRLLRADRPSQRLATLQSVNQRLNKRTPRSRRTQTARRSRSRNTLRPVLLVLLLLGAAGAGWWSTQHSAAAAPFILLTANQVTVDGTVRNPNAPLRWGQSVTVGNRAIIRCPDGSTLNLGPDSHLVLNRQAYALERGWVEATVTSQVAGSSFRIRTAHGMTEVLGTRFRLSSFIDHTHLQVSDGRVALSNKHGRIDVIANQAAECHADRAPRRLGQVATADTDVIHFNDDSTPAEQWAMLPGFAQPTLVDQAGARCLLIPGSGSHRPSFAHPLPDGTIIEISCRILASKAGSKRRLTLQQAPSNDSTDQSAYKFPLEGESVYWLKHPVEQRRPFVLFSEDGFVITTDTDAAGYERPLSQPITAGTWAKLRLRLHRLPGAIRLQGTYWPADRPEPTQWQTDVTDHGQFKGRAIHPTHWGLQASTNGDLYLDDVRLSVVQD